MECNYPDGLSKYHHVLTAVPSALLNPIHPSSSPSFFSYPSFNQCSSFIRPFFICLLDAASPRPPLPPLSLTVKNDPNGQMSLFQTTSLSLDSGLSWFLRGWDSEILTCMRSRLLAGETDHFLSRNKSLHHPQTEDALRQLCLQPSQPLETTDQLRIEILI